MPVKIAPSILTADFGRIAEQVQEAAVAGADYIHLDVMDGHFVPVISFGPSLVAAVRRAVDIPLDIHLMIERPRTTSRPFATRAATSSTSTSRRAGPCSGRRKRSGASARRRASVSTPAHRQDAVAAVLGEIDQVMVMAVNPGWGRPELHRGEPGQGIAAAAGDRRAGPEDRDRGRRRCQPRDGPALRGAGRRRVGGGLVRL